MAYKTAFDIFAPYFQNEAPKPPAPTGSATGGTTYSGPGGTPSFTVPTAAEIAANQNTYNTATLGNYLGLPAIQSGLKGELAPDVVAGIAQRGAERGAATGMPGAPASAAATQKALGLTSYQVQQDALKNLNAATATIPQLNPLGISGQALGAFGDVMSGSTARDIAAGNANLRIALSNLEANQAMTAQEKALAQQRLMAQWQQQQQMLANQAYAKAMQDYMNQWTNRGPATGAPMVSPSDEEQEWRWYIGGEGLPGGESYAPAYGGGTGVLTGPGGETVTYGPEGLQGDPFSGAGPRADWNTVQFGEDLWGLE